MEQILDVLRNNHWNTLKVQITDQENVILDNFKSERNFINYLETNLSKYDVNYLGHELVENQDDDLTIVFKFAYSSEVKILSNSYIEELAEDIMLELSDAEILDIKGTENSLRKKFLKVLTIDTEKVNPMYFPVDDVHDYLREDEDYYTTNHEEVLENAPSVEGDYISIVKVVK